MAKSIKGTQTEKNLLKLPIRKKNMQNVCLSSSKAVW